MIKEVVCEICGHLLFKIDTETFEMEISGNKINTKFYGNEKPLLKHIEIFTTCDKCKDIELTVL